MYERTPDPVDRAALEADAQTADAVDRHRRQWDARPRARADGSCGCGCGEPVEAPRLRLGLGLTLHCASVAEARGRAGGRR